METRTDGRSLGELFTDLTRDVGTLVRQEVQLATSEMSQKVKAAGKDIGLLVGGGLVLYAGFIVLLGALAILLDNWLDLWLATLIVAVVAMAAGAMLVMQGKNALSNLDMKPRKTMQTIAEIKEDIA